MFWDLSKNHQLVDHQLVDHACTEMLQWSELELTVKLTFKEKKT
jgi:hypothetical protein